MRIGCFLLLSLALHAMALSYPVFFSTPRSEQLLPVIVLGLRQESGGDDALRGDGGGTKQRQDTLKRREPVQVRARTNDLTKAERIEEAEVDSGLISTPVASEGVAVASNQTNSGAAWDVGSAEFAGPAGGAGDGSGGGKGAAGGYEHGNGNDTGSGGGEVSSVGVSYAYNPKPEYPDTARKEGREGTVVLRVLVDEEGRSKLLEVNRSSGSEALDKAAMDTVRRWRFHSARYGDKRVESWVKIPMVFQLADSKL
jgi:protein TonB